jgi:hypothetical protein
MKKTSKNFTKYAASRGALARSAGGVAVAGVRGASISSMRIWGGIFVTQIAEGECRLHHRQLRAVYIGQQL